MKKNKLSKQIVGILSFFIVVLCVGYYFAFVDVQNKNKHISELQNSIDGQSKRDQYLMSIEHEVENAGGDIAVVNGSILGKDDDVKLIELLESTGRSDGLTVTIDSLVINDDSLTAKNLTTLDVTAKMSGSWSGMYAYLNQLESFPYTVRIEKFAMMKTSDASAASKWQGVFEIRILKYK